MDVFEDHTQKWRQVRTAATAICLLKNTKNALISSSNECSSTLFLSEMKKLILICLGTGKGLKARRIEEYSRYGMDWFNMW
jgi:hypothetical protein